MECVLCKVRVEKFAEIVVGHDTLDLKEYGITVIPKRRYVYQCPKCNLLFGGELSGKSNKV